MNFYAVSGFIVFLASFLSGFFVLLQNPRDRKNIHFFFFMLSLGLWSGFYTLWQSADNPVSALRYVRLQMVACAFLPVTQYQSLLILLDAETPGRKKFCAFLYALAIVISFFGFSPYFIPRVEPRLGFPYWPVPGFFIHILFAELPIPYFANLRLIWDQQTKSSALAQNQLRWLLLASIVGYGAGGTNCPLWYNIPVKPYPMALVAFMPVISAFIFFRLGLFDIRLFLRRFFLYFATCLAVGLCFSLLAYSVFSSWKIALLPLAMSFLFPPIFQGGRSLIEALLVKTSYWRSSVALKSVGASVGKIKESTYTYDDLAKNIVSSLLNTFPIEMAAVYFYDLSRKELHLRAQRGMKSPMAANLKYNRTTFAISDSDPLMIHMNGRPEVVSMEGLQEELRAMGQGQDLIDTLKRIEADICAPFLFEGKVKGMLVLSKKKDNTLFNTEDVEAIYSFARMGEEIMRYIMGMETELKHTTLYSHDMAHDIRSVLQTLDFLLSPMATQQSEEKRNRLLSQAKDVTSRLYEVFQDNRDRSNLILRAVRGEYEREPVDLSAVLKRCLGKFTPQAEEKKVRVENTLSSEPLQILGNEIDLGRMVDNVLGNALRYVSENGHISLASKKSAKDIQIDISDNGKGIEPEYLNKIWEMGWQAQDNKKGSAGLGLSIVKQIVDLHQGTIEAQSDGLGKGTKFVIKLPVLSPPTT